MEVQDRLGHPTVAALIDGQGLVSQEHLVELQSGSSTALSCMARQPEKDQPFGGLCFIRYVPGYVPVVEYVEGHLQLLWM
jgi:hypothetical protein